MEDKMRGSNIYNWSFRKSEKREWRKDVFKDMTAGNFPELMK